MRVTVRDRSGQFDRQTLAYAEYRAFESLAGRWATSADVSVTLARPVGDKEEDGDLVLCSIAVGTPAGEMVEVEAVARHPCAAVDTAVSLIREESRDPSGRPGGTARRVASNGPL